MSSARDDERKSKSMTLYTQVPTVSRWESCMPKRRRSTVSTVEPHNNNHKNEMYTNMRVQTRTLMILVMISRLISATSSASNGKHSSDNSLISIGSICQHVVLHGQHQGTKSLLLLRRGAGRPRVSSLPRASLASRVLLRRVGGGVACRSLPPRWQCVERLSNPTLHLRRPIAVECEERVREQISRRRTALGPFLQARSNEHMEVVRERGRRRRGGALDDEIKQVPKTEALRPRRWRIREDSGSELEHGDTQGPNIRVIRIGTGCDPFRRHIMHRSNP
mmetsp:Transcript_26148/g.43237  ORF Transcript_26148/g.43237 Transcript_26148/m.43237 type:complete len:278 (+) Transcript_26148:723-1556(+)